jgi:DNA-binding transcriptional regulator YiaG
MASSSSNRAPSLLKQARQSLSLTQPAFAHRMHVTKRTIVRWESGLSLATPYILASATLPWPAR